jgi:hypothetical protein
MTKAMKVALFAALLAAVATFLGTYGTCYIESKT